MTIKENPNIVYKTKWFDTPLSIIRFEYGYRYLSGNTDSHVFITYDERDKRGSGWGGGVATEQVVGKYSPKLLPFCRWHLCGIDSGPLHYLENAKYWWEISHGRHTLKWWYRENSPNDYDFAPRRARENLIKHIVYGALEDDFLVDPYLMTLEDFISWLDRRRPALVKQLRQECDHLVFK